jgi:protein TorT
VQALIVSAVSVDGVNDLVARAAGKGVPVVDLINGMSSPEIAARAAPSYWVNANVTGRYLRRLQGEAGRAIRVAWFPGPEGAAWVRDADAGFRAALEGAPIEIVSTRYGDTGRAAQAALIDDTLDSHADGLDYLVGTAPTAEAAASILRRRGLTQQTRVLSFYFSPGVYRGIRRTEILAAPADGQGLVSRIAVDLVVRILEKREHVKHVAPIATVVDVGNVRDWEPWATLAPRSFRPVFRVNAP